MREVFCSRAFLIEEITYRNSIETMQDFEVTHRQIFLRKEDAVHKYEEMFSDALEQEDSHKTLEDEDDEDESEILDYEKGGRCDLYDGYAHVKSFSYFDAETDETVSVTLYVVESVESTREID